MDMEHFGLGAKVYAKANSGVCSAGERGVVVEEYRLGARSGRTIVFERGGYDGFSADEIGLFVVAEGSVDGTLGSYRFEGVHPLQRDLRRGAFAQAFATAPYAQWLAGAESAALEREVQPAQISRPGPRA